MKTKRKCFRISVYARAKTKEKKAVAEVCKRKPLINERGAIKEKAVGECKMSGISDRFENATMSASDERVKENTIVSECGLEQDNTGRRWAKSCKIELLDDEIKGVTAKEENHNSCRLDHCTKCIGTIDENAWNYIPIRIQI